MSLKNCCSVIFNKYHSSLYSFSRCNRHLSTTSMKKGLFHEKEPKSGYVTNKELKNTSQAELIRLGLKELKSEIILWKNEMKERFEMDPITVCRPNETDVVWQFENPANLNQWVVTSDQDHGEGLSKCTLELTSHGKALFSGNISTRVPKDGRVQRSGYCNMRSVRARKSFKRETYYDWTNYNKLVMKVRGDGRSYMLNLSTSGYFDITWNDVYHYILFTRGGPYWQIVKIPFSKFFLSSKGRIQDKQWPIPLDKITNFGITLGDKNDGEFQLEIDYIGLEFDPNHYEEFAYEMYKTDKYITAH